MILLNFAHPLPPEQRAQIEARTGQAVARLIQVPSQVDPARPLAPQVTAMLDACGLSPTEWQTMPLLVNPPALNFSALVLLAALHGRCGYFAPVVRLHPVAGAVPPRYKVAEILDLQAVRAEARRQRAGEAAWTD